VFHHTPVLVLALGIGIGIGQYYWVLGIGCLFWYRSNPSCCVNLTASPVTRNGGAEYKGVVIFDQNAAISQKW